MSSWRTRPPPTAPCKETTAYLLRDILESVITSGTGTEAYFSGMTIAGKTGTTDDNRDRYFVGFSPYYCAAVWTGYESNDELSYGMGNGLGAAVEAGDAGDPW